MTDLILERFWSKVKVNSKTGCWEWIGSKQSGGYGQFWNNKKIMLAHRFSYETNKGKIPLGLDIDHLCRNRVCVNPDHMEPVTRQVNLLRGISHNSKKTHCPRGHEYTKDNLIPWYLKQGKRKCKRCSNPGYDTI